MTRLLSKDTYVRESEKTMIGNELEGLTFTEMPDAFWERTMTMIFAAYENASTSCWNDHSAPVARNLVPFKRRALIEDGILEVAALFHNVEAKSENHHNAWWSHSELQSGPVIVTVSHVLEPAGAVRGAKFRKTLANNGQGSLFDNDEQNDVSTLYALLIHSDSVWETPTLRKSYQHLPGSMFLVWPDQNLDYVHKLNLFERYPDVVKRQTPEDWDQAMRLAYVRKSIPAYKRLYGKTA